MWWPSPGAFQALPGHLLPKFTARGGGVRWGEPRVGTALPLQCILPFIQPIDDVAKLHDR